MIGRRSLLIWPVASLAIRLEGQLPDTQRLEFTGIGPVAIGMTEAQVRSVLKQRIERTHLEEGCSYLTGVAKGVAFMLLDSRVARVDITRGSWLTEAGAGIGTSEAEIRRLYPQVRVEPHPYFDDGQGHYLRVTPTEPKLRNYELLFESEKGAVTSFRAGLSRAVGLIEGCS
jgi:hypothetical protein